ncbi:unnamed protein product, partial [Parnassius mnemosyne]
MRYSDVKALIRDRCGLTDLILDNLTYVHPDSYKVTVGLTNENDAAIIFNNLNGLDCLGQKLYVEDLRKKKQSSKSLDYTGGNQMQQKEQGNNIRGVQKNISRTQPMPTKSFYGPMNAYSSPLQSIQASAYQYLEGVSQKPYSMAMNTQTPASYDAGVGGKYGASSTTIILNTNTPSYNVSPSFGNDGDQQGLYNSNDSQSNFISYSAKKPFYQSYNVNQDSSRYFQKKNDEPHTSDNRQSLDMHTRDTSDRSKRMPSIRNERETYESHNRSNTLIGRQFDDWNRSDDFSKHSDSFISYPSYRNNKSRDNYSDTNQRQVGDVFSRHSDNRNSYPSDRNNKPRDNYGDRNQRQVGDVFSRHSDNRNNYPSDRNNKPRDNYGDRNQRQVSNYKEGVGGNVVGKNYSQHSNSAYTGGDFNRPNNLNPSETDNNSFFNQSNLRGKNEFAQSYKAGPRGIASDQGFRTRNVEINKKQNQQQFPYSRGNDFKESRKAMNAQPPQYQKNKVALEAPNTDLMSKKKNKSALTPDELSEKHRDQSWRGQAVAAIAKRLLMKYGKTRFFAKQPKFIHYLKPYIKTRVNEILGKRVAVHFEQIIDEYNQRYPLNTQQAFLNDIKKQFQRQGHQVHVSGGVVKASGSATVVNKGIKRAANDDGNLNPAKISKKQSESHPSNVPLKQPLSTSERLPKYPGGDKKEHNKLKRMMKFGQVDIGDVFKMDPQLKKVRDDEIDALCNLFLDECKKPANQNEAKVCKRIMNGVETLRNELRISITKRVLNITQNIPLRIYTNQKIKSVEIDNHLKKLGIVSLRKARGRKLYIGMCTSFNTHDKLCDMGRLEIGGVTLLFRPMNSGGKKVKGNIENDGNKKGAGDFDQDNTDDIEDFGDEDIGYDEDDYDEEHSDDNDVIELQSDDNNDVEIIDDKPAVICVDDDKTNVENKNTDGAKSEISQTKDETSKSEKISVINVINNSDKANDNKIQKSETENLLKDIQTLADCISNEENVNGVNVNTDNNS